MVNKFYKNVNSKEYFKRYGLVNGLLRGFFISFPFHFVSDYEIKKLLWQRRCLKKIKKYISNKNINPNGIIYGMEEVGENPIWIYWNSGISESPDIIKACYNSLKKYSKNEIITLDENNVENYVKFPSYINDKIKNGNISIAGYTDLLRFCLLEHYGGTWIDATVFLTDYIPKEILNSDFFVMQNSLGLIDNAVLYPAWFMHAKKGNKIIKEIRNVAFSYWMKENHVIEYLLPNLIITLLLKEKSNMLYMNSDYSEYLAKKLADRYDENEYAWIKKNTCIHKLTYKLCDNIDITNTYYDHIICDLKK